MWQYFGSIESILRLILAKQSQTLREVQDNGRKLDSLARAQSADSAKLDRILNLLIPPPVAGFSVEVTINQPLSN